MNAPRGDKWAAAPAPKIQDLAPQPALPPSLLPFYVLLRGAAAELLRLDAPMWLARAPGVVDVLGGPAEHPGTVTLSMAIPRAVYTAIQNRDDQRVRIRILRSASKGGNLDWEGDVATIYTKKGPPRSLAVLEAQFAEDGTPWMMELMAWMIGLRRTHQLNTPKQGFDLVAWDHLPDSPGFGEDAAFATSISLALKASTGLDKKRVDGLRVGRAVVHGAKEVLGWRLPVTEALTSGVGQHGCMVSIEHGVDPIMQWVPVPEHVVLATIDAGVDYAVEPGLRMRAAVGASMALEHLNAALRKAKQNQRGGWGQVTPAEFEGGLRDHVPAKETGAEWLKRFKRVADDALCDLVDPEDAYRLRAIAEHHVRESGRSRRFVQQLQDYARTKREDFLVEAGRALNSSHRSLREKCGIQNEAVDKLLGAINKAGRKAGLFGGRLAEAGEGSAVVVLAHVSAMERLRELVRAHAERVGAGGTVLTEIGQGGVLSGWWEGVLEATEADAQEAGRK